MKIWELRNMSRVIISMYPCRITYIFPYEFIFPTFKILCKLFTNHKYYVLIFTSKGLYYNKSHKTTYNFTTYHKLITQGCANAPKGRKRVKSGHSSKKKNIATRWRHAKTPSITFYLIVDQKPMQNWFRNFDLKSLQCRYHDGMQELL